MAERESSTIVITRRQLLRRAVAAYAGIAAAGVVAVACKGGPTALRCDDTTGVAPVDNATRKALEYVEVTPDPQKTCASCAQYVVPSIDGTCGGCKMFKGPVNPKGYCKSWVVQPAPQRSAQAPSRHTSGPVDG
jgi:hypothetical protein